MTDLDKCDWCFGTGCPDCPSGACPRCYGLGYLNHPAIDGTADIPCPFPADRNCPRCGCRTVSVKWKSGQAIARCCHCDRYICSMPKTSIARGLRSAA